MEQLYFLKDVRFLLLSFGGSVALSVMGFLILPEMMRYLETHVNKELFLNSCFFIIFFVISLLLLAEITFRAGKLSRLCIYNGRSDYYKRIFLFCIVAMVIYLAIGLLSGGISVLIHRSFAEQSFQEQKLMIDLVLSQLPILVMPVIIMQFMAFSFFV